MRNTFLTTSFLLSIIISPQADRQKKLLSKKEIVELEKSFEVERSFSAAREVQITQSQAQNHQIQSPSSHRTGSNPLSD